MRRIVTVFVLSLLAAAAPRGAGAQNGGGGASLVEVARAQLDLIQPDTAAAILLRALDSRASTAQEQLRAWTLLGIAELMRGRQQAARFALRRAIERDPQLRVDSLGYLHSDLRRVFASERENIRLDIEPPALVGVRTTVDTTIPSGGRLVVDVAPRRRVRLSATITPNGRNDPVWTDEQLVNAAGAFEWDLTAGGAPVAPGRYLLRIQAADPLGRIQPATRTVLITRTSVDTLATPELSETELLPDSVPVRPARSIIAGAALGVGTLALASLVGNDELNGGSGARYVVAGTVSVAAIMGFLKGRQRRYSPANAMYNDEVIARHNARVMEVNDENQRRLASAMLRVRIGTPRGGN